MWNKKLNKALLLAAVSLTVAGSSILSGGMHVGAEEIYENTDADYEDYEDNGGEEGSVTWTLENGTLTVSGTGEIPFYEWYGRESEIKRVVINVTGATDVWGMFSGYANLEEVDLKGFDTSQVTDMAYMFSGCSNLTRIDLSSFNTSNVTDMRGMFENCSNLTSVDLSSFNTGNVTDMEWMFDDCHKLAEIKLGNGFNTSGVTDMFAMFYECHALKTIDISRFDTSSVTNMGLMFSGCNSLTSLDISHFDFSSLVNEDGSYNLDGIMSFGNSLSTVKVPANLPEEISLPITEIGYDPKEGIEYDYVWKDENQKVCESAAAHLSVPMTYTRTKELIASDQTDSLVQNPPPSSSQGTSAKTPASKGTIINASSGKYTVSGSYTVTYTGSTSKNVKSVTIPASISSNGISYNVTAIAASAFANCKKLKSVIVGANVTSIGKNAWKGCKNLKKITVKTTKLKSVGKNALKNIHKKCKITVPSSKLKDYKKKFKNKGQKSSVKIQ